MKRLLKLLAVSCFTTQILSVGSGGYIVIDDNGQTTQVQQEPFGAGYRVIEPDGRTEEILPNGFAGYNVYEGVKAPAAALPYHRDSRSDPDQEAQ
jgi:hypothetical protein